MSGPERIGIPNPALEHFYAIADNEIEGSIADKGGCWSPKDGLWVDSSIRDFVDYLAPEEQAIVEALGRVGLAIGEVFRKQLDDVEEGVMWPPETITGNPSSIIPQAYKDNPDVADPYSVLPEGLHAHSVPYSSTYCSELAVLRKHLSELLELPGTSLTDEHRLFIRAMLAAYEPDAGKTTDYADMGMVDMAWLRIPPDAEILFFAQPTEVYHDPARIIHAQDPQTAQWANEVTNRTGLGPWRTFFEFRLLIKDESMVTEKEMLTIRNKSRELFGSPDDPEVATSTEFRRLLMASGNGAHPAKTAKNYPNQEDIRDNHGYKNVLYTNMLEEGTRSLIAPALVETFGEEILSELGLSMDQLVRGSVLRVVAHEENHPFGRFRDSPLEELKSTINGMHAVIESGRFSEEDVNAMLLTEIGAALYGQHRLEQAIHDGDQSTVGGLEAYRRADTMMMNYFVNSGVFVDGGDNPNIDFERLKLAVKDLVGELKGVRSGLVSEAVPLFYELFDRKCVWENFRIMEVKSED